MDDARPLADREPRHSPGLSSVIPRGSATSRARRYPPLGEVRQVRRLRCSISGCGVSIAVAELLDRRCVRFACVMLGGACHLNRRCDNQCRAKNFQKCRLHGCLLNEAPLSKTKCNSLCASSDKNVTLDDEHYYCARSHKAASKFFGQRLFRPKYWARLSAVWDVRLRRLPHCRLIGRMPRSAVPIVRGRGRLPADAQRPGSDILLIASMTMPGRSS